MFRVTRQMLEPNVDDGLRSGVHSPDFKDTIEKEHRGWAIRVQRLRHSRESVKSRRKRPRRRSNDCVSRCDMLVSDLCSRLSGHLEMNETVLMGNRSCHWREVEKEMTSR